MLTDGLHAIPAEKVAMIVTYLEMTSKPEIENVALPEGVTFRQVDADPEWYRDVFKRVGSQDWLWYGRLRLSDAELAQILNDPQVLIFTLSRDGRDEALLELDFCQDNACELAYFALTSCLIGTGSGRYLMNEAIRRAWERSISRFHVQTCTIDSPQALGFYRRSGFTPIRQAVEVDDDPRITGVLSDTAAPNVPRFRS